MLRLVICEFMKLRRKKFILLVALAALLFPVPLMALMRTPQISVRYESRAEMSNDFFQFVMGYGVELLLPCVIGVIAAMLFFMERDNATFKNLRTIPVTSTQMVFAKIMVLFFFGVLFSLATAFTAVLGGSIIAEASDISYKFLLAVEMGIFTTAGTLPLVLLVVFFSRTYIFSVLMCVFYSVLSLTAETCFETLPKWLCWLMPIPLTTLWSAGDMVRHSVREPVALLERLAPTTFQTVLILAFLSVVSVALIDLMYKRRGDE